MVAHKLAKFGLEMMEFSRIHVLIPDYVKEELEKDLFGAQIEEAQEVTWAARWLDNYSR